MMFGQAGPVKVFVATRPVDFRKGIDGLSLAVQEQLGMEPFSGAVFVFRTNRADRIKLLVWEQRGMVLVHKRLEGAKFVWPQVRGGVLKMSPAQLSALFEGLDWRLVRPDRGRRPSVAGYPSATARLTSSNAIDELYPPLPNTRRRPFQPSAGIHISKPISDPSTGDVIP